jgi:hypothetical protein
MLNDNLLFPFAFLWLLWLVIYAKYIVRPLIALLIKKFGHFYGALLFLVITTVFAPPLGAYFFSKSKKNN